MTALTDIFGNPTCYWCNIGSGFQGTPDSNGDCICESYLALNGYECKPVCGDGFLVTPEDCDDGNLISGDGCSPSCIIETGYKCANGSLTTPSICMYIGIPLKASLESI
jgi:cysteine-rich repeat protein